MHCLQSDANGVPIDHSQKHGLPEPGYSTADAAHPACVQLVDAIHANSAATNHGVYFDR